MVHKEFVLQILLVIALVATPFGVSRSFLQLAGAARSDLKSDIENELENETPEETSRNETRGRSTERATERTSAPASGDIEGTIDQAKRFMESKQYKQVIDTLTPLNNSLPRAGLMLLARAHEAKNDPLNEIRTLELCIAKNPKDYVVRTVYGHALVRSKRVEDALVAFQEARQLNPRYKPAYDALKETLEKKGERYEARNVINDMINTFGRQKKFMTDLCRLYALDSFTEKSIEICSEAIKIDSQVPENHMYLGLALKDRDELERAKSVLSKATRRFPSSEPVHSAMGEFYLSKKDYVRAYDYYKTASTADPKAPRAWIGYGNAAFNLQKNQEALTAYSRACKIDKLQTKDFRSAIGVLRVRKDFLWQSRYEMGINGCQ